MRMVEASGTRSPPPVRDEKPVPPAPVAGSSVFQDDEGNVYARSFRPESGGMAGYQPMSEPVEAGDVVSVDRERPGFLRLSDAEADPGVVGIVSGEPGLLLDAGFRSIAAADAGLAEELALAREVGDSDAEDRLWLALEQRFHGARAPVALSGIVLCKVDATFGSIQVGDLLTTSPVAGHAMRAADPAPGTILGKALEGLEDGSAAIRVLVMPR